MRLLHITDTHLHTDADTRLRGVNTYQTLASVLNRAMESPRPPHMTVATGDLSQDETAGAYKHFHQLVSRMEVPVWCVPGNHDAPAQMTNPLSASPCRLGGTLVAAPWCVIMLDSFVAGDDGGRLDREQLRGLEKELAAHRDLFATLAVHHHPLPVGSRWLDELGLRNSDELFAIIDRFPRVRCVLSGHVHQEADLSRNNVRYLSTPSTCFQFLPQRDRFAIDERPPGFRWLDLRPDGSIDTEVVWVPQD